MEPFNTKPFQVIDQIENKSINYSLPPGKPNAKIPRPIGPDTRPRVKQKASRYYNNSHYVFNLIRERIGPNPPAKWAEARRVEIICSMHRKEISAIYGNAPAFSQFINSESIQTLCQKITKTYTESLLKELQAAVKGQPRLEKAVSKTKEIFTGLVSLQANDLCDNLNNDLRSAARVRIDNEFLKKMGTTAEEIYKKEHRLYPNAFDTTWEELNIQEQNQLRYIYTFMVKAKAYNLKPAHWRPWPGTGINFLISELNKKGPMIVLGQYGYTHYVTDPKPTGEVLRDPSQNCAYTVYAWTQQDEISQEKKFCDPFLITGAKILENGNEVVYYVETSFDDLPINGSRRIYTMSFQTFREYLADTRGFPNNYEGFFPWGYHAPESKWGDLCNQ